MAKTIRTRKINGIVAKLVLYGEHSKNPEIAFLYGDAVIETYKKSIWENIRDEEWIVDIFFSFAIERYLGSLPSKEYLDALSSLDG